MRRLLQEPSIRLADQAANLCNGFEGVAIEFEQNAGICLRIGISLPGSLLTQHIGYRDDVVVGSCVGGFQGKDCFDPRIRYVGCLKPNEAILRLYEAVLLDVQGGAR